MPTGESSPAGRPQQPAYVDIVDPVGKSTRVSIVNSPVVVGRVAECPVRLEHPMVSRQHARFERHGGRWRIVDLQSHNGTRVNKKPATDAFLVTGDLISIGPFNLTFHHRGTDSPLANSPVEAQTIMTVNDQKLAIRTLHEIQPPHIAVEHLKGLEELTRMLMQTREPAARLATLCKFIVQSGFGGRWAVAVSMESASANAVVLSEVQFSESFLGGRQNPYLSRSLLTAAYRRREPMLASNAPSSTNDEVREIELSIAPDVMLITAMAIPLPGKTDTRQSDPSIGRADLLYAVFPPEYGTGEWLALSTLAVNHYRQSETIWANIQHNIALEKLTAELERARRVQERLVPRKPRLPGLDVAVRFKPCHAVGGDYVDVLPLPDGRALLVVADVCGKGLHAAMVAMGIHTLVHSCARRWAGLDDLASTASAHLVETLPLDSFVTFLAITLDPNTGELEVVNGGHPAALIAGESGVRQFGQPTCEPLGYASAPPVVEQGQLAEGESLVLFTDGCFEIVGDGADMLGLESFYPWAAGQIGDASEGINTAADALMLALDKLQADGPPHDDRTMLLVRRDAQLVLN